MRNQRHLKVQIGEGVFSCECFNHYIFASWPPNQVSHILRYTFSLSLSLSRNLDRNDTELGTEGLLRSWPETFSSYRRHLHSRYSRGPLLLFFTLILFCFVCFLLLVIIIISAFRCSKFNKFNSFLPCSIQYNMPFFS